MGSGIFNDLEILGVLMHTNNYTNTSCGVKIPIIGTFFYKNVFMQVKPA
jgi:hypothetical protein